MKYKAIIFDLDGTLVDSLQDIADSLNEALSCNSHPTHSFAAIRQMVGNGLRNLITSALPAAERNKQAVDRCLKSMLEIYWGNCSNKTTAYSGINELLSELQAKNIPIAVLSNKADAYTKKVVSELFPRTAFTHVCGMTDEATRKPDPSAAIRICNELGIATSDAVFVGDSDVDMLTAHNAGMYALGVAWGYQPEENLQTAGADLIISHSSEILKLF